MDRYRLLIDTSDEKGLVYHISSALYECELNIEQNSEYVDKENNKFFMRTEFSGKVDSNRLLSKIKTKLPQGANIKLSKVRKKHIAILVTKESHAFGDLLIRHEADELDADIVTVISNYDTLRPLSDKFKLNFHEINADSLSREEHEKKIVEVLETYDFDYIVLAKYMRILTPSFVQKYHHKIINIHHSFLPAFIGANPYKQAHSRGVKIIGATSHFVTNDLDEGPIIYQDVVRVNHEYSASDMKKAGKDVEKIVLAKALNLVLEDRVFIYGNKTVIF